MSTMTSSGGRSLRSLPSVSVLLTVLLALSIGVHHPVEAKSKDKTTTTTDNKAPDAGTKATKHDSNDGQNDECGLYLAESSIKGAGWGVFAGRDFECGERVVSVLE